MSIALVMPSNHLNLYCPLLLPLQSFPASGSLSKSLFFASGGQSIGFSASSSPPFYKEKMDPQKVIVAFSKLNRQKIFKLEFEPKSSDPQHPPSFLVHLTCTDTKCFQRKEEWSSLIKVYLPLNLISVFFYSTIRQLPLKEQFLTLKSMTLKV